VRVVQERFKVGFQPIEILERVRAERENDEKLGQKKERPRNTYSCCTHGIGGPWKRRGMPSEWELRKIRRGIRLLKSANAFKCHNRSLYRTAERHIVPIVHEFDYKIQQAHSILQR